MTREEKQALAGDYVLGLLDDAGRSEFLALAAVDPELRAMADRLAERMRALDATATPARYGSDLWARIERRLDEPADRGSTRRVVTVRPPARRLPAWLPLAASVVVALGVGYFAGFAARPSDQPTVIAIMLSEADGNPAVILEAFADDSVHLVPLENFAAPDGQVLQVWTLPDVATGPVSLGTLARTQDLRLDGPNLPVPQDGQLYEITLEPAPGSPTGRPTGPILVKGFAKLPVR